MTLKNWSSKLCKISKILRHLYHRVYHNWQCQIVRLISVRLQGSSLYVTYSSSLGVSVLDLTTCTNDLISLQNLFKTWFHDCSTDSEHLQIFLPPSLSSNQTILLKCDLHERMLHPSTLSTFTKNFVSTQRYR